MNFSANVLRDVVEQVPRSYWTLAGVAGRLVEISSFWAPAALSLAFSLVLEAQRQREPVGWVMSIDNFFYPPDVSQAGVDLGALVVVRTPNAEAIPRAGEKLLRSGAFGLIVLDIGSTDIPMPLQARLGGLVRQYHTALVCLTEKENRQLSLGSLISLRVHAYRTRAQQEQFSCNLEILKDKRRGPTWSHTEIFHAL